MLESRNHYGYGGTGVTDKATRQKYQVCYRTIWGSFGEIGYKLFDTKEQAAAFGEQFKCEHDYVTEIIIRHPRAIYSAY